MIPTSTGSCRSSQSFTSKVRARASQTIPSKKKRLRGPAAIGRGPLRHVVFPSRRSIGDRIGDFYGNGQSSAYQAFRTKEGRVEIFGPDQPGGRDFDHEYELSRGSDKRWPDEPEFVTAKWRLVGRMQEVFPLEVLKRSMGSNITFLRWPRVREYLRDVPTDMRDEIAAFSTECLGQIIDIVEPQEIVTIDFASLGGEMSPDLRSPNGRVLSRRGTLCGREAIGMMHLTGARISGADRRAMKDHFSRPSASF